MDQQGYGREVTREPVRVLCVGEFDPCCISVNHRDWLKRLGVEIRVLVRSVWSERHLRADWVVEKPTKVAEVMVERPTVLFGEELVAAQSFAESADIVQIHPGIGPTALATEPFLPDDFLHTGTPMFGIDWSRVHGTRLAYFHGSRNTWARRHEYADYYRGHGYRLAASTLDYVAAMACSYLPPIVVVPGPLAARRTGSVPLTIAHTPTDPAICSTKEFLEICGRHAVPVNFVTQRPWGDALVAKRFANAGFDHLRGSFSVNTVENAAMGLVPLVGMSDASWQILEKKGFAPAPWPKLQTVEDLERAIVLLASDVDETVELQQRSYRWWDKNFSPNALAPRIADFYRRLAGRRN